MILIIAGNYEQYTSYVAKHHLTPETHRYVFDMQSLLGLNVRAAEGYMVVGTIYQNPASTELINKLERIGIPRIQT